MLVLVLLAGVVGGLGQWWADGGSQAVQLARCGALLAEAWEAAVVEEVLFRGVLLWACLSWARRRNEAYPRRAPRAHRHGFAGLRAVVDPVGFAVMASSLIFGLAHLFPEGSLMAPGADIGVAAIQGVLTVTQSTLFGAVMALLVVRSP
ncbi:type II CAAX prenyl endopeptidase Rce1 family protein, partial [Adlercreutzia sp. DFI.6.23]|uniref:CPBP family glutamic-type intramembrane protease n=1 Tax=Adlercreutzia sp. DFI.6.23 TaxID=2963705 RepID=UPI00210A4E22|nr:CPBP family glutamic-type intramembrane protease [Adlercreutzia sp. DFI.6.23]